MPSEHFEPVVLQKTKKKVHEWIANLWQVGLTALKSILLIQSLLCWFYRSFFFSPSKTWACWTHLTGSHSWVCPACWTVGGTWAWRPVGQPSHLLPSLERCWPEMWWMRSWSCRNPPKKYTQGSATITVDGQHFLFPTFSNLDQKPLIAAGLPTAIWLPFN